MKTLPIAAALSLLAVACSSSQVVPDGGADAGFDDPPVVERQTLCDGQKHLRLWVLLGGGGQELAASYVRVENGSPAFIVDGTCEYWATGEWRPDMLGRDRPVRTGTLTEADVKAIEASIPLDDITPLADCPPPPAGFHDYSTRVIRTETDTVTCAGTSGVRFDAAWTAVEGMAARLWDSGRPADGAIHVSAFGPTGLPPAASSPQAYAWPLALPLSSFLLDSSFWSQKGVSSRVDDPVAADLLRTLRDQYLAERSAHPGLYSSWDGLIAADQTTTALVYMRDAMPYEDARGLLVF